MRIFILSKLTHCWNVLYRRYHHFERESSYSYVLYVRYGYVQALKCVSNDMRSYKLQALTKARASLHTPPSEWGSTLTWTRFDLNDLQFTEERSTTRILYLSSVIIRADIPKLIEVIMTVAAFFVGVTASVATSLAILEMTSDRRCFSLRRDINDAFITSSIYKSVSCSSPSFLLGLPRTSLMVRCFHYCSQCLHNIRRNSRSS